MSRARGRAGRGQCRGQPPQKPKGRGRSRRRAGYADNFAMDGTGLRKHVATPFRRRAAERPPYLKWPVCRSKPFSGSNAVGTTSKPVRLDNHSSTPTHQLGPWKTLADECRWEYMAKPKGERGRNPHVRRSARRTDGFSSILVVSRLFKQRMPGELHESLVAGSNPVADGQPKA